MNSTFPAATRVSPRVGLSALFPLGWPRSLQRPHARVTFLGLEGLGPKSWDMHKALGPGCSQGPGKARSEVLKL